MCFSIEADIVTGLVVTGVGIDTLRHIGHDREAAVAALPVVFGVHQLIEVPVWLGLTDSVPDAVATGAAWLYLAVAFALIPILVPVAVRQMETDQRRRALMARLTVLGAAVAIALMIPVLGGNYTVTDGGNHIAYSVSLWFGGTLTALYVLATCGSLLLSSDRALVLFGAINLVTVTTLAVLANTGVISLWCVWAAVTSVLISAHLRWGHRRHQAASVALA